jgi:hypothetical protein
MDREAIGRASRRRLVLERLDDERNREAALVNRLEEIVTELAGPAIDQAAYAKLTAEQIAVVREAIEGREDDDYGTAWLSEEIEEEVADDDEEDGMDVEAEIARLEGEIAASRSRQEALQAYLDAIA